MFHQYPDFHRTKSPDNTVYGLYLTLKIDFYGEIKAIYAGILIYPTIELIKFVQNTRSLANLIIFCLLEQKYKFVGNINHLRTTEGLF